MRHEHSGGGDFDQKVSIGNGKEADEGCGGWGGSRVRK